MTPWLPHLTLAALLGSGIMAGCFFAFSNFVMPALARRPAGEGMAAMQAINVTVLNPGFLGVFMGTTLLSAVLGGGGLMLGGLWVGPALAAALLYMLGTFAVTVAGNVPLNDRLEAVDPAAPDAADAWAGYLRRWTFWNHVRTAASMAATVGYALAFARLGGL